jgi:hypothetical protein
VNPAAAKKWGDRLIGRPLQTSLVVLGLLFSVLPARAHDPSKSYLNLILATNEITGQWDIPLVDLQTVVPLDADKDGFVTWEELNNRYQDVLAYARAHLRVSAEGRVGNIHFSDSEPTVGDFADGTYVELPFVVEALPEPKMLELEYRLFFEVNPLHRGLLRLESGGTTQSAVFMPTATAQRLRVGQESLGRQFVVFLEEGIGHIWTGYDHILFLLALLLPSVLRREANAWSGVAQFRPAAMNVIKIVTAFTLAHSLTLSLATLHLVKLPSRLTESAIAASVILAATNNLRPMIQERGWMVAFVFGLIHGFGFANALSELGLEHTALLVTLVGFNLGVEIGQLAIVAVFLPVAFGLRRSWLYQTPILRLGSAVIILISGIWLAERVFNLKLLPF